MGREPPAPLKGWLFSCPYLGLLWFLPQHRDQTRQEEEAKVPGQLLHPFVPIVSQCGHRPRMRAFQNWQSPGSS